MEVNACSCCGTKRGHVCRPLTLFVLFLTTSKYTSFKFYSQHYFHCNVLILLSKYFVKGIEPASTNCEANAFKTKLLRRGISVCIATKNMSSIIIVNDAQRLERLPQMHFADGSSLGPASSKASSNGIHCFYVLCQVQETGRTNTPTNPVAVFLI